LATRSLKVGILAAVEHGQREWMIMLWTTSRSAADQGHGTSLRFLS
jgi:hypothetical protein